MDSLRGRAREGDGASRQPACCLARLVSSGFSSLKDKHVQALSRGGVCSVQSLVTMIVQSSQ